MANRQNTWTIGTLKSRGWTDELARALLPRPLYRHFGGRAVRSWRREDVEAAEDTEAFKTFLQTRDQPVEEAADVTGALESAGALLAQAWALGEKPEGEETLLALRFHEALQEQVKTVTWADRVKPGQAMSYIDKFLRLRRMRPDEPYFSVLRRFVTAAPWLGRNAGGSLAVQLREGYAETLLTVAKNALEQFRAEQPRADAAAMLNMTGFPAQELLSHPLGYVWSVSYVPKAIRTSLNLLVALDPRDEYPQARAMKRHFVLHIGGTNTGKTYAGFQRLMEAQTGVYLAPLRLLALEAQEVLLDAHVACSLTTGEEEDRREGDTHVAATAEKLDLKRPYDVAVVDECQMIADRERGYAWTRAILGVLAPEVHLCAAPEARNILVKLIKSCGDSYEIIVHRRKTPLVCMERVTDYESVRPGDALITFSKVGVLSVAEDLRAKGKKPAIIYGALPYSTRRRQVQGFLNGEMEYVVSTDAIGMGLNLPIRRIIFMDTQKFDGVERRALKPEEIQQIAGRAGRYGMYDRGYVGATENLSAIREGLETVVPPLQHAVVGFSDLVMQVEFDLLEVLEVWNRMPTAEPYVKLDISRYITVISRLRESGFTLTKEQELRAANIPFDETDDELSKLFTRFLKLWKDGQSVERPELTEKRSAYTLPELEQYCRKLDLYFSFAKAFDCPVDRQALHDEREKTADLINQILLHNLKNNIRFCPSCGAALPLHHSGRLCARCYARRFGGAAPRHRR